VSAPRPKRFQELQVGDEPQRHGIKHIHHDWVGRVGVDAQADLLASDADYKITKAAFSAAFYSASWIAGNYFLPCSSV
jgi:hypothetical protein